MINKRTIGIIRKPHISYDTFSESWLCSSEDGPWDLCIGAGESVLDAYGDWESSDRCVEDFCVVNWAEEVDRYGNHQ